MRSLIRPTLFAGLLLALSPGLRAAEPDPDAPTGTQGTERTEPTPMPGTTQAPTAKLDDGQIAMALSTANDAEVREGELARTRATNADVKAFAESMVKDHTMSNKSVKDIATRAGVKPAESEFAKNMRIDAKTSFDRLQGVKGAAFDRAYIDAEVGAHQALLDAIDKQLLTNVSNPEMKTYLTDTRQVVEAHLDRAKTLQTKLRATPGTK
jgi:putative membrane protein